MFLVVVVVDLIIVILFLVCRVAQKQLLKDAILIIVYNKKSQVVFYSRFKFKKELKSVGKKERKKKDV